MNIFSDQGPENSESAGVDIPKRILPYKLTREERAAILQPDLDTETHIGKAGTDMFGTTDTIAIEGYEAMCGAMSLALRRNYRFLASFRLRGVEQQNFQHALCSAKSGSAFLPLLDNHNTLRAVFIMDNALASAFVEFVCGGEIRRNTLTEFGFGAWNAKLLLTLCVPMTDIWLKGSAIELVDSNAEFCQSLAPNKDVMKVVFSAKFGDVIGQCLLICDSEQ